MKFKLIIFINIFCILFCVSGFEQICAAAGSLSIDRIDADLNNDTVIVKGTVDGGDTKDKLAVEVVNPGKNINGIDEMDILNLNDVLNNFGEAAVDENGGFIYKFLMAKNSVSTTNDSNYKYIVRVTNPYETDISKMTVSKAFNYANSEFIGSHNILNDFNGSDSVSQMKSVVEQYRGMLFNMDFYDNPDKIAEKLLSKKPFSNIDVLQEAYNSVVTSDAINNSANYARFKQIIDLYPDIVKLDLNNVIFTDNNIFSGNRREEVFKLLFDKRKTATDFEALREAFKESVLIKSISFLESINKGLVLDIMREFRSTVVKNDSSMETVLNKFFVADSQRFNHVANEILRVRPKDISALKSVIRTAMDDSLDTASGGIGGSNGGGGGGGVGGGGYVSGAQVINNVSYYDGDTKDSTNEKIDFSDINTVPWAVESILGLAADGKVQGYNGEFRPNDNITRCEFVKILVAAFDLYSENSETDFADVPKSHWSYYYIASAQNLEIVQGLGDNIFGIDDNITRQEMAAMIYRVAKKLGTVFPVNSEEIEFLDQEEIEDYAVEAVNSMKKLGIINGYEDGRFRPVNNATRAEAAKIIYSLINNI